mmetsp:Transcript_4696/g.13554  ORF Transcript_4696/g.13554 Transcript_4696/m.13554 type:complete len:203 (-) Transcript_4696:217-825(-)
MMPPPHLRRLSGLLLYFSMARSWRSLSWAESSLLTPVRARHEETFWWTRAPRRALSLTIMYGTSILRHSAGIHMTSSSGSTSQAIRTSSAFFSSIKVVTCFSPNLATLGTVPAVDWPPAALAAASLMRCFLAAGVSGRYLLKSVKTVMASFLDSVLVNWLTEGGTLRRWYSTARWRWMRTYFGHLTKRERSRPPGRMAPPIW